VTQCVLLSRGHRRGARRERDGRPPRL